MTGQKETDPIDGRFAVNHTHYRYRSDELKQRNRRQHTCNDQNDFNVRANHSALLSASGRQSATVNMGVQQ